jgi:hypothetical protein
MAQADSVPSPIPPRVTDATANLSTKRLSADRRYCIDEGKPGQVSAGEIAALCYATAVLLLAWFPWNILLILFLFLCRDKRLRFIALDTVSSARCGVVCRAGSFI